MSNAFQNCHSMQNTHTTNVVWLDVKNVPAHYIHYLLTTMNIYN